MFHQVLEFFLRFPDLATQDRGLFLLGIVKFIDLGEFLLCLKSQSLCDVKVIVCSFVVHLISGQLLLCGVEADTDFFLVFLDLGAFGPRLLVFQFQLFLAAQVLLLYFLLQSRVELVVCCQEFEVLFSSFRHISCRKYLKVIDSPR